MSNLAASYTYLGRYADAIKLHEETLALRKVKLGPNHPDTAETIYDIACVHALMIPKSSDGAKNRIAKSVGGGVRRRAVGDHRDVRGS